MVSFVVISSWSTGAPSCTSPLDATGYRPLLYSLQFCDAPAQENPQYRRIMLKELVVAAVLSTTPSSGRPSYEDVTGHYSIPQVLDNCT